MCAVQVCETKAGRGDPCWYLRGGAPGKGKSYFKLKDNVGTRTNETKSGQE